ncbi:COG1361 family protein [Neorhodopirellula pilleata]|uniref:Large cysteine-rich periplasmic protein OmcB n=1 Tax=Neorhodopirellula pilleata TaxID=2714738 RepID=A0A5C6AAZ1_9BACT|nr:DUF11 domain-containing protein [Neorhodopirellula pilleata]TWT96221.1 Large cysteine-rich periplasmic protein OmcB precursor [Neorhodopirellula pilleata]
MTRNRIFRFLSPPRQRRRVLATLVAAAVATQSIGIPVAPTAFGQSGESSPAIRQVAGKELNGRRSSNVRSGGLLSGLFGGGSSSSSSSSSSGKADEPYRKATPVPSDRDVNWQGIPTHGPSPARTASRNPAPIQDPSSRSQTPSSRTEPAPVAQSRSSAVPTPPPVVKSVPRPSSPSVPRKLESPASVESLADVSSDRPEPLSLSRSSRRSTTVASDSFTPTKLESKTPVLVPRDSGPIELVPKVSRKVVKAQPAPSSAKDTKAESTKDTSKEIVQKSVPAKEPIAATPSPSSRRVAEAVKPEMATAEPEEIEVIAEAPTVVKKPIAVAKTLATPNNLAPSQSLQASSQPQPKAKESNQPAMSTMSLGEARQSEVASQPMAAAPAVASPQAQPEPMMSLPTSSPTTTPVESVATKATPATNHMTTFGTESGSARSGGSLSPADQVALQPISDRLPAEVVDEAAEAMKAWHESQNVSHDGFAARSDAGQTSTHDQSQSAPRRTTATYSAAAFGSGQGLPAPPTYQSSPSYEDAASTTHPNTMRESMTAPATSAVNPSVAPNTTATATELPGIRVMTAGPRSIMIRQTHPYEVIVENRGSVAAEGLLVRAHIPDWADVVGQQVTRGEVQGNTDETIRNLHWKIDRLEPGQTEKMFVRLKASRPGTHDLDVDWTMQPQTRKMQVTVQQPELALTIDGPDEVIYGQSKTYQIRVLNPGDGIAPDVVFTLSPKSSSPQSQRIGDIPAGKEAQFEVELTAQDLGELKIHGMAVGDLELKAEANKTVRVLAADLEAVLSGPELKYQDAEATYQLQLTNHGTTASENVIANLQLPMGVTYQGGMEGASLTDNQLRWKIASLSPGAVRQYQFQCRMNATGTQSFKFDCKGSAAGQTTVALDTNVEAIADLVLTIEDPQAPAPIGQDVVYQIVIRNRGSKPATDVRAVAQFSHGIEPSQITGHTGKVITGQVLIEPIPRIEAGEEVRMKIVAKAETSGHHRFRTEVRSGDTVLVAEEATHYLEPRNERITRRSGPGGNEFSLPLR